MLKFLENFNNLAYKKKLKKFQQLRNKQSAGTSTSKIYNVIYGARTYAKGTTHSYIHSTPKESTIEAKLRQSHFIWKI